MILINKFEKIFEIRKIFSFNLQKSKIVKNFLNFNDFYIILKKLTKNNSF